jgi:hypothetical protein
MIVSDDTIWSITLEASIMLLEASFAISAVIIYDRNTFIVSLN